MSSTDVLFRPFELGRLQLANRIVMAPMTRSLEEIRAYEADMLGSLV